MQSPPDHIPFVVSLAAVRDDDAATVGAKAAGLARMLRAGLPVPPGFCLTRRAYHEHIRGHDLAGRIERAMARLADDSGGDRGTVLAEIREAITGAPLAAALTEQIERCWRELGGAIAAVRSSATAEDLPQQSFAGQHDSYLGVADLETCLRRVRDCWASLWSERAFEYRCGMGTDALDAEMAVIVQALAAADAAGVMFTADPVTGRRDWVVIEGSFGLGEAVVSGKVTPDRIVVSKRAFLVERRTGAQKELEVVALPGGGVRQRSVDPARAARPCLDDVTAGRLAKLGAEVEMLLGAPQDVEWAVAAGRFHLLQARPITALPPEPQRSWADRQLWTNSNVREAAPDVVTPMTWSLIRPLLAVMFDSVLARAGIEGGLEGLFGLVEGRAYFNVNMLLSILRALPGSSKEDLAALFGGGGQGMDAPVQVDLPDEDLPDVHVRWFRRITRGPDFLLWFLLHPMRTGPKILDHAKAQLDAAERQRLGTLPEEDLSRRVRALLRLLGEEMLTTGTPVLTIGMGYSMGLAKLCRRWFGQGGAAISNRLLAGLGGMEDAEAGIALWRLAAVAHEHPAVEAAILGERRFEALRRRIAGTPGGEELLASWSQFMQRHGHHARGEIELGNPRWAEMPDYVLALVRSYLPAVGRADPLAQARRLARRRRALAAECERRLRDPVKRMIFQAVLRGAQQGLRFRETSKSLAVRWIALVRWTLLELGDRLARRDAVCRRDDIFFLRLDELGAVVSDAGRFRARAAIARRRAEHERNAAVTPPPIVFGRFDPEGFAPPVVNERADVFRGFAVSGGVASGKARVILHTQDDHVRPGEVLVAPITDPGWTPYFLNAAAIVIDQGGMLSHGSIIAREYGIPCVVNVGPATRIIKTGQQLEVDGDRGVVRILP